MIAYAIRRCRDKKFIRTVGRSRPEVTKNPRYYSTLAQARSALLAARKKDFSGDAYEIVKYEMVEVTDKT